MVKKGISPEQGWKEEEDLAKARQKIESDLAGKNLELDLHMKSVVEKIDKMVDDTIKVKEDDFSKQLEKIKEQEEIKRKENKKCLLSLKNDLEKVDLNDIEDWAFSRLCTSDSKECLTYD